MKKLNFNRVVFTSDIMRPFKIGPAWESATWKNIQWLSFMLKTQINIAGLSTSSFAWSDVYSRDELIYFDAAEIYSELNIDINYDNWATFIQLKFPPEIFIEKLKFLKNSLVIGYELPEIMVNVFDDLDIPYIDIVLHPIRFMPDLIFGFRSNVNEFQARFEKLEMDRIDFDMAANEIRAKKTWMNQSKTRFTPGSVVILGQVEHDRATVMGEGNFASLDDHLNYFHDLSENHSNIYFKPHPYQFAMNNYSVLLNCFPSIKLINENIYDIFSRQELIKVVALNSSGLMEAKSFGIDSENLIPYLYNFGGEFSGNTPSKNKWIALSNFWLSSEFWKIILNSSDLEKCDINNDKKKIYDVNRLRKSLNADWGFGEIDKVIA